MVFARMDASENEVPGLIVTAYPTLFFFTTDDPMPVLYDGDYSTDELIKFIKIHTTSASSIFINNI